MIATRPANQVKEGDKIHGISIHKVLHKGTVIRQPYPHTATPHLVLPIACEDHGPEELVVHPDKLANVERSPR